MASSKLLTRNGLRTFNLIFRPHSTLRSAFMGRNATLAKKNTILLSPPSTAASSSLLSPNTLLNKIVRGASSSKAFSAGSHSAKWNLEHYVTMALLLLIPTSLVLENPVTDYLLAVTLVAHTHSGMQNILTDYVHGPTMPKVASAALCLVSALALLGLFYFNYGDVGISKAIKKVWSL